MLFLLQTRILLVFLPQRLIAGSQSAWCLPGPPCHSLQSCFSPAQSQSVLVLSYSLWCILIKLSPAELHDTPVGPHFQVLKTHLNGNTTINRWCINRFSQFCIICRGCPIIWVTGRDMKQHWPRADPCSAALVTGFQMDFLPLITALWAQQFVWPLLNSHHCQLA